MGSVALDALASTYSFCKADYQTDCDFCLNCILKGSTIFLVLFLHSKAFHSLVHHALSSGSSSDAESKEEALAVYQDVCEIIENRAKVKTAVCPTLEYAESKWPLVND